MRVELVFQILPNRQAIPVRRKVDIEPSDQQGDHTSDLHKCQGLSNTIVTTCYFMSATHLRDHGWSVPVENGAKPALFLTIVGFEYHRSGIKSFGRS